MSDWQPWLMFLVAVLGQALTILALQRGARYRHEDTVRSLEAKIATVDARITSQKEVIGAEIDKVAEVERRARHDLANNVHVQLEKQARDMRELERNTVRREDMQGLEARVNGRLDKIDAKLDRALERAPAGD